VEKEKRFGEEAVIQNLKRTSVGSRGLFAFSIKAGKYTADILARKLSS
jgi:hypothetical protein